MTYAIDIELTNRCNARCHFCPRDATPHQGLMTPEVFDQALRRAVEYVGVARDVLQAEGAVSLCGLGEPLLNRHAPAFVRQVREAGLPCQVSSNGALLDERRAAALLEAGLQRIFLNVGDLGDDYERVYRLPFQKTLDNVLRFEEMAGDRCEIWMVLVDHRRDRAHAERMKAFWRSHGIERFVEYDVINRGGALFVDHMQFESLPQIAEAREILASRGETPLCGAPFAYLFVGYDGRYYLCCSDWKKEAALGSVFDASFLDVAGAKLRHLVSRAPVCRTCNLDPLNRVTEELRARDAGQEAADVAALADGIAQVSRTLRDALEKLSPGVTSALEAAESDGRRERSIPVLAG